MCNARRQIALDAEAQPVERLVLFALEESPGSPVLIADAGFMYAAKMSGSAAEYDRVFAQEAC